MLREGLHKSKPVRAEVSKPHYLLALHLDLPCPELVEGSGRTVLVQRFLSAQSFSAVLKALRLKQACVTQSAAP